MRNKNLLVIIILAIALLLLSAPGSEGIWSDELAKEKDTLRNLLPIDKEIAGWKGSGEPEFFDPENLWRYIDGQAEMYLDYGFRLVVTVDYRSLDNSSSVSVEIYQFESPNHAFGIYAAERSPDDNFIEIGVQGYLVENVLNFWKGTYYIKLTSFQTTSGTSEVLIKLASIIANKIRGSYSEPELFACFPEEDRVKMTERFIPKNFLGQPFLKNGYQVEYQKGESSYQAFLAKSDTREEAEVVFGKYRDYLKSQNEQISFARKNNYRLVSARGEVIFQYGAFVGGVLSSDGLSETDKIIEEIVQRIRNLNPQK